MKPVPVVTVAQSFVPGFEQGIRGTRHGVCRLSGQAH